MSQPIGMIKFVSASGDIVFVEADQISYMTERDEKLVIHLKTGVQISTTGCQGHYVMAIYHDLVKDARNCGA